MFMRAMTRFLLLSLVLAILPVAHGVASAQTLPTLHKKSIVALLWHESPNDRLALKGLRRGLKIMGQGSNLQVVFLNEDADFGEKVAVQCERVGVAAVVPLGTEAALLVRQFVRRVPVVFTAVTNPVLSSIVKSWGPSQLNITGNSNWLNRISMLKAFRDAVPNLKRLSVITSKGCRVSEAEVLEARKATKSMDGFRLDGFVVKDTASLQSTLKAALEDCDALWVPIDIELYGAPIFAIIRAAAEKARVPIVSTSLRTAGQGALLVATISYEALGLRAAGLLKQVLSGRDAGTIPIGRMRAARYIVDLAAARRISLEVPWETILGAHRLIGRTRPKPGDGR